MMATRRLLYYSPATSGGLADYANQQAQAFERLGINVTLLTAPEYVHGSTTLYHIRSTLPAVNRRKKTSWRLYEKVRYAFAICRNYFALARLIEQERFQHVLLGSYAEYLAPVWTGSLEKLARRGVVFGAVVHDPVRDYVVGPLWWHRWSIACGYRSIREAFVHEEIELDTAGPMPNLHTTVIPHGPYTFPQPRRTREQVRSELKIPSSAIVFLSFGHIRDGKNLDLVLKAMAEMSNVYLVVAGKVSSGSQRPVEYYQSVARDVGVANRCRWLIDFIPADQVGDLFHGCDGVMLTYNSSFRSASGVLNAAVAYRRPCIASAGQGNLGTMVEKYGLGIFVKPDDTAAIRDGIQRWLADMPQPRWDDYTRDNSWDKNAEIISARLWGTPR